MEYRFFYPIDERVYDTNWRTRSKLENRTDVYFILPRTADDFHLEHGLKLRNQKKLELKRRERRFPNGQEYWLKTIHAHKSTRIEEMDVILKTLRKSNEHELIDRVTSAKPLIVCYVSKVRDQFSAGRGLTQELTGLHLRFVRLEDQALLGDDRFFEAVCVEQSDSKLIDEDVIQRLSEQHKHIAIEPMGYPEFLFRQYEKIINE